MLKLSAEMQGILTLARRENASDIHIVADLPPLYRINGDIVTAETPPLRAQDTQNLCFGLLNEEQRQAFKDTWQLCCSVNDPHLGRFRVSMYYHAGAPEMAIRPVTDNVSTREELHLPEQIEDLSRMVSGLVLLTGPTGSGKTTTMNYMIDLINSERRCKIIAIEDPVEYIHHRKKAIVIQQELYTDVKSFSSALIHVLRQDPDVICIGEMRDMETTETALIAAETGHLVIATCHTPNTIQTVERIVSIFPENKQAQIFTQLANCLRGILAQRLIPATDRTRRCLATELLLMNPAARKHIRDRQVHFLINVIQTGRKQGMRTMDDSLLGLYESGEISYDLALNNAYDPVTLRDRMHKVGADRR
jgi:twitching motility protein PilT